MSIKYTDKMSRVSRQEYLVGSKNIDRSNILSTYGTGEKEYERKQIYYNITIPHNDPLVNAASGNLLTPATYFEIRDTPFFNGPPDEWYMSIVRFSVPTAYIPIGLFPIAGPPNTDPNLSQLSVTLSYSGNDFQTFLIWVPQNTYLPVPPPPSVSEGAVRNKYVQYYSYYSVQHYLDILNTAFSTAFANLKALFPGAPPTEPPFMSFTPSTGLFTLYAQTTYAGSNTISIYMNDFLYQQFKPCFNVINTGSNQPNGKNELFVVEDLITNQVTLPAPQGSCYAMNQEYNTIANWFNLTSIVFTTGSIPIRKEWLSTQEVNNGQITGSGSNFFPILTDFEIDIANGNEIRSFINYNPTAQYRYIDLQGKSPISTIDLQIYWKDNYDNLYPILIGPHDIATVKVLFEKKMRRKDIKN